MNPALFDTITLGAGCFWCVEAIFQQVEGVVSVQSGYSGGFVKNPAYREVCNGTTGHAEVCQLVFDSQKVSVSELLEVFWQTHDPTTLNRQGADVGTQYRSTIYCTSDAQLEEAKASRDRYQASLAGGGFGAITTEIIRAPEFFYAEEYHQQYLAKNPDGYCGLGGTGVSCAI